MDKEEGYVFSHSIVKTTLDKARVLISIAPKLFYRQWGFKEVPKNYVHSREHTTNHVCFCLITCLNHAVVGTVAGSGGFQKAVDGLYQSTKLGGVSQTTIFINSDEQDSVAHCTYGIDDPANGVKRWCLCFARETYCI